MLYYPCTLYLDASLKLNDDYGYTISGLSNLTSLSFRRNAAITAQGMRAFSNLVNMKKLDLEKCPGIHGGLVHLRGKIVTCFFFSFLVIESSTCYVHTDGLIQSQVVYDST